ncbi:MAG: response regulator [Chromatiales bacterium]|nr:response regulator [Chromatiales bacterium]
MEAIASFEMTSSKHAVLIVDDDARVAQLMARIARSASFTTHVTYDSSRIEEKIEEIKPNVLVLDLQMPGTDGVPGIDGVPLLNRLAEHGIQVPMVLVGGMGTRTLDTTAQVCGRSGCRSWVGSPNRSR